MRRKTRKVQRRHNRVWRGLTRQNIAQATVTISVGIAFALATFLAGGAAGHWGNALKEDIKWSAGLTEDVRYLFTEEAPFAYEYAATIARADALAAAVEDRLPSQMGAALLEAHAIRSSAESRREDFLARGDTLLEDKYWQEDHFDVDSRLKDARADARTTVVADPEAVNDTGDRLATAALGVSLVPVLIAAAYLGWIVRGRRRTGGGAEAEPGEELDLIPDPTGVARGGVAGLAFLAWLLLVILPPLQIYLSLAEDKASAESSAGAVAVMRTILVSNLAASFEVNALSQAEDFKNQADARAEAYRLLPADATSGQAAIVEADNAMVSRYRAIAEATTPSIQPGPDITEETVQEITADPDDWQQILAVQNAAADETEHAGQRNNAMTLAVVLAGIATTLTALAEANRRSRAVPTLAALSLGCAGGVALLGLLL